MCACEYMVMVGWVMRGKFQLIDSGWVGGDSEIISVIDDDVGDLSGHNAIFRN